MNTLLWTLQVLLGRPGDAFTEAARHRAVLDSAGRVGFRMRTDDFTERVAAVARKRNAVFTGR
jgi:hypothetical protein